MAESELYAGRSGGPLVPARYKCFDCGWEKDGEARTRSFMGPCEKCNERGLPGILVVYTFDGEPVNRGYFPEGRAYA